MGRGRSGMAQSALFSGANSRPQKRLHRTVFGALLLLKQERNRRRFAKRGWAAKAGRGPACGPVFERQPDAWPQPSPHTARQRRQPRKYHMAKMEKALAFGMSFSPFISNQGKEKCLQSVSDMENHAGRTHINPFSAPTYCETGVRGF